jgi:hypothetical protein
MTKQKIHSSLIAAIVGVLLLAEIRAYPQLSSAITDQPQNQVAQLGADVTLSFGAIDVLACQWMCNGVELDGQTNSTLTIENVQIADAGYYSSVIATSAGVEETSAASVLVYTVSPDDSEGIVVFGAPITQTGNQGTCPGAYKGYVNYIPATTNGWGWVPSTNTTTYTAADENRTNTKVEYVGAYGDNACDKTSVTIPYPAFSPVYRFTIFFTNNVPTTNYPITLTGFNPL